jgi:hypothetical protein
MPVDDRPLPATAARRAVDITQLGRCGSQLARGDPGPGAKAKDGGWPGAIRAYIKEIGDLVMMRSPEEILLSVRLRLVRDGR